MFKFLKKADNKPIIVAIHGFGRRRTDELNPIKEAFSDYKIITPELFDQANPNDDDWATWLSRAENALNEAATYQKDIILIGYSMGGVIASYFANKPFVTKLILIAPAFEYQPLQKAGEMVIKTIKKTPESNHSYIDLPSNFTNAFTKVVSQCKKSISDVNVPTLLLHGDNDETIDKTSSIHAYDKIKNDQKILLIVHNGGHKMLDDPLLGEYCLTNIKHFICKSC